MEASSGKRAGSVAETNYFLCIYIWYFSWMKFDID